MEDEDLSKFPKTGIISPERMRAVDKNAADLGVSALQLMESAGKSLAGCAGEGGPSSVLVLCGGGNNGGDGFVAARYLSKITDVHVIYPRDAGYSDESAKNLNVLDYCKVVMHPVRCRSWVLELSHLFSSADCIVDAILGTGGHGDLREPFKTMVYLANSSGAKIISADMPTPGIHADTVCAFHRPKQAGSKICDIGIPVEAEIYTGSGDLTLIPKKKSGSHKGEGGSVLVIGGGPYQGAPYLAALAALRGGADIVRVATPNLLQYPDLIVEKLEGEYISGKSTEKLIKLAETSDSVVLGNGLGDKSHNVVQEVSGYCKKAVFDADSLRLPLPFAGESIYTPHSGEFERISGVKPPAKILERADALRTFALDNGGVFLLKGKTDIVTDGDNVRFNRSGCSAMTKGGTGDVLAGLCGALLCRLGAFDSACIAAYVNGCAGEKAAEIYGDGLKALDIIDKIPGIMYSED
ncbi:NAD(P)H-hydrate epimerase [Methanomicrobium sp. W14]|uniref:NAD(P)H-hydrate dehydratase n=1 Tax=Methanomicrobium sp. W14 TaxID=2817839 RepID=UPI001AE84D00|nr:NAD(P)H-hydrate dehydratase [Methanomicrobium sp. W14]MBP2132453.1 NAD(P)H-hydrate epimerase [Methanomicrobium sp. W14]